MFQLMAVSLVQYPQEIILVCQIIDLIQLTQILALYPTTLKHNTVSIKTQARPHKSCLKDINKQAKEQLLLQWKMILLSKSYLKISLVQIVVCFFQEAYHLRSASLIINEL
jgi:hypothetical protein